MISPFNFNYKLEQMLLAPPYPYAHRAHKRRGKFKGYMRNKKKE